MTDTVQVGTNYIVKTPGTLGGRARIDSRRISVGDVVNMHIRLNATIDEIIEAFELTPAQIHAALAYYYDHRVEIDSYLDEAERQAEAHSEEAAQQREELLARLKERDPEKYDRLVHIREAAERDNQHNK